MLRIYTILLLIGLILFGSSCDDDMDEMEGTESASELFGTWEAESASIDVQVFEDLDGEVFELVSSIEFFDMDYTLEFTDSDYSTFGSYKYKSKTEIPVIGTVEDVNEVNNASGKGTYTKDGEILTATGSFFGYTVNGIDLSSSTMEHKAEYTILNDILTITQNETITDRTATIEIKSSSSWKRTGAESNIESSCTSPPTISVRVLVLDFAPLFETAAGDSVPIYEHFGWTHPVDLSNDYVEAIHNLSNGTIDMSIVGFETLNDYLPGGVSYSQRAYELCVNEGGDFCFEVIADYNRFIKELDIAARFNNDEFDELWVWGGGGFGLYESAMAGPGAFYINGGVYPDVPSNGPFAIMGFNYSRGLAEMLHSNCHRAENSIARAYGGWDKTNPATMWDKFAASAHLTADKSAGVGHCHYTCNSNHEYDYDSSSIVMSSAEDWYNYPDLTGELNEVSSSSWGGPNYELNYMKWWFDHLPNKGGTGPDGKLLSWWVYIYDLN